MKKIFSLLLVVVMLFAMGTTAFAAGNGSITIDNAVVGETYTIWRLLDLSFAPDTDPSEEVDNSSYSYTVNWAWTNFFNQNTIKGVYVNIDAQGYVTWVEGADAAAFAKAAKEYATTNSIANQGTKTADSTTVEFTGLDLGYYLVDTTLGTLCSLDTTDPSVTIKEKNEVPIIEKEVEEDSTPGTYGDSDDANIGQVVNFKTTVTAKEGAEGYVVHDILSAGLTLNKDSIAIAGLTKGTDYTVAFDVACKDKDGNAATCDFEITFAQSYLDTITADTEIIITYSATVNENAVIGLPGNPNDTILEYSDDNWTEWDETVTYTWDVDVLKYANGDESKVLADAKFVLLNNDKTKVATFEDGKFKAWADVPTEDGATWPAGSELTTGADGKIAVDGLDGDTYYLRETKAPAGYNKLSSDIKIEISYSTTNNTTTVVYKQNDSALSADHVVKVNNQSGTVLPETGAEGTMMFITIGSLLAIVAVVFMVTRKKMSIYER